MEKILRAKAVLCIVLITAMLATGCGVIESDPPKPREWLSYDYFDTFTGFYDYSEDGEEEFKKRRDILDSELSFYHKLFDIYENHEGVSGLKAINDRAGEGAVKACPELIDFLLYCRNLYDVTEGAVNIAMGAVLSLWHDYRSDGKAVPTEEELLSAGEHCDIDCLVIDRVNMTVELTDPYMSLDVGAVGKGYAVEKAAQKLSSAGADGCVIDAGGNLRAIGTKPDGSGWITGITDPSANKGGYACRLELKDSSVATSGNYHRYYEVDGVRYHHIIDGETLMPAKGFTSVSVIAESAALADGLSTALFVMSYQEGRALAESFDGVEVVWITEEGELLKTEGITLK